MGSAAFCYKSLKRLEPTVVQLLLFLTMSDDAAATAPAAAVPAGAAPLTRGQDQLQPYAQQGPC